MATVTSSFTISGESVRDLEDRFAQTINSFLVEERLDSLVYDASEQSELAYVYKKKGPRQVRKDSLGTFVTVPPLVHQEVTPRRISLDIPTEGWLESIDPVRNHLLRELAQEIAWDETQIIVESLQHTGREFQTQEKRISETAIVDAYDWIRSNENTPETIVVHPFQETHLMESKAFLNAYSFPEQWRRAAGNNFSGILLGANVYWTPAVPKKTILLYEKMETRLWRTPLRVKLDTYNGRPSRLHLSEECVVWAIDDNAVAKIVLKQ